MKQKQILNLNIKFDLIFKIEIINLKISNKLGVVESVIKYYTVTID